MVRLMFGIQWLLCSCALSMAISVAAQVYKIASNKAFDSVIHKHDYVVVFVYSEEKGTRVDTIEKTCSRLKDKLDYKITDLACIKVNIKNDDALIKKYGLHSIPAVFLLKKGTIPEFHNDRAVLYGYPTRLEVVDLIDQWFGNDIKRIVEIERERAAYENERINTTWTVFYGSPVMQFGYWDWPQYRPGYIGFHGGWGIGALHHRH